MLQARLQRARESCEGQSVPADIIESFFVIFAGAAALAALALFTRQPLIVAYIAIGCAFGPYGLKLVPDASVASEIGEIGIIFLLFLVGLELPPSKLKHMVGQSVLTAVASCAVFFGLGFGLMAAFGFSWTEAVFTGVACMFSSTILGIKLLPTTVLHHRHTGELVIALLLIQDLVAVVALLVVQGTDSGGETWMTVLSVAVALPLVVAVAFAGVRYAIEPLLRRFDVFAEFTFLLAIGWCLGVGSLSHWLNLSWEIGAFAAGVALANSIIAPYITESLRPLRDFFLVLFFFAVGASIDPAVLLDVWLPTLLLAAVLVAAKPFVFQTLLRWRKEPQGVATEIGYRLGQGSEFSLLLVYVAGGLITADAAHVVQGATVLTLLLSSYLVIFRYPSPIAVSKELRRD